MNYLYKILKLIKCDKIKTKYSHHNLIYKRGKKFVFSVDCSGLVEFWLKKTNYEARNEVYNFLYENRTVDKSQIKRLFSFDFYDFFNFIGDNKCSCWQKLSFNEKLKSGDIIAFINPNKKGRYGHVAVVEKELYRDVNKIVVKIIDSSQIKHFDDFRQTKKMGIGCGIIELYMNDEKVNYVCYCPDEIKERFANVARLKKK